MLSCPVYLSGAIVACSSGTVSVYDPSSVAWVSAAAVTVSGGIATYTITSGILTTAVLGEGWRTEWSLTLSDGTVLTPRNRAALCRNGLWPVIGDVDLYRRVPSLDPAGSAPITSISNFQGFLDESWTMIQLRLIGAGNRPNLILEPSALREVHLLLALTLVWEDQATRNAPAFSEIARTTRADYERAWNGVSLAYDSSDSGVADSRRRPLRPVIFLCGGRG